MKFGEKGHGYHMSAKLADTFRFFNPVLDNVYCEVVGFGKIVQEDDYLYDSAPMYVVEKIIKILSREDILQYILEADVNEFRRFLALYPFTKEELEILRNKVVCKDISYKKLFDDAMVYQCGDISTFKRNKKYLRNYIFVFFFLVYKCFCQDKNSYRKQNDYMI